MDLGKNNVRTTTIKGKDPGIAKSLEVSYNSYDFTQAHMIWAQLTK